MQRPTSVTVFGVLNIVFAVLGIFSMLAMMAFFAMAGTSTNNPVIQLIQNNPAYASWMKLSLVLGVPVAVVLLAAGIGLLKLKPWARIVSIAYGIYAIVMVLAGMVVNYIFLLRPMLQEAQQQQGPQAATAIGGAVGGTFGSCFGLIYPILLLIFMLRPNVVAAFRPPVPADGQPPAIGQP
jgi:hypothetical protein